MPAWVTYVPWWLWLLLPWVILGIVALVLSWRRAGEIVSGAEDLVCRPDEMTPVSGEGESQPGRGPVDDTEPETDGAGETGPPEDPETGESR